LGLFLLFSVSANGLSFATSDNDWDVQTVGEFTVDLSIAEGNNKMTLNYSGKMSFDIVSGNLLDGSGQDSVTMKMRLTTDASDCTGTGNSSVSYNIKGKYEPSINVANIVMSDFSSPSGNIEMTCKMTISGEGIILSFTK